MPICVWGTMIATQYTQCTHAIGLMHAKLLLHLLSPPQAQLYTALHPKNRSSSLNTFSMFLMHASPHSSYILTYMS